MSTFPSSSSKHSYAKINRPFVSPASMAKSPNEKSKPHFFLRCFGFSGNIHRFKPLKSPASHRKRPFSWMRFHSKPLPPVQSSFPAQKNRSFPDSGRLSLTSIAPAPTRMSLDEDFAVPVSVETNRTGAEVIIGMEEIKNDVVQEKIIHESNEKSSPPKKPTDQRFSFTKKLESFRSVRFTQPVSPTAKKNPKSTNLPTPIISHSLSFPRPNPTRINRVNEPPGSKPAVLKSKKGETRQRYRSAAAMSVLMITLAMMVLWGKICAILCTATWIFVVTSLRSIVEEYETIDFVESDSYSEGFKKKLVVLKGFLCRNHRQSLLHKL